MPPGVNSKGARWQAWQPILEQQPELRLLVSHLGPPPPLPSSVSVFVCNTDNGLKYIFGACGGLRRTSGKHAGKHWLRRPQPHATVGTARHIISTAVLGSWVGARRPFHLSLSLTAPRMVLHQYPSTVRRNYSRCPSQACPRRTWRSRPCRREQAGKRGSGCSTCCR